MASTLANTVRHEKKPAKMAKKKKEKKKDGSKSSREKYSATEIKGEDDFRKQSRHYNLAWRRSLTAFGIVDSPDLYNPSHSG